MEGDPTGLSFGEAFDAIVGRLVLMYYPDPVEALRRLATCLKPGGLLAFQEADDHGRWSVPEAPLHDQCLLWITGVLAAVGAHTDLGFGLHRAFVEAGLGTPHLSCCASVGGGAHFDGYGVIAEIVRGMLPNLARFGLATPDEVGIDSLESRLRDEAVARRSTVVLATLVGAWARVSG